MPGPKMGNEWPGSISTYPTWVAHETPYTAEWGNSVGYEFYLMQYDLGPNLRKGYDTVGERLDAIEAQTDEKQTFINSPFMTCQRGAGSIAVEPLGADIDAATYNCSANMSIKSTRPGGWEFRIFGISKVVEADGMMLQVKIQAGQVGSIYDNRVDMDLTKVSETTDLAVDDLIEWKFDFSDYAGFNNLQECRNIHVECIYAAASGANINTDAYISFVELFNDGGIE